MYELDLFLPSVCPRISGNESEGFLIQKYRSLTHQFISRQNKHPFLYFCFIVVVAAVAVRTPFLQKHGRFIKGE